ncbi:MAG: DUF4056 domain-containing protein [Sedimentisphaerales bacterium]|nr:DUF4056 domain-containing protein [Sedimentisphaerales bacterium]
MAKLPAKTAKAIAIACIAAVAAAIVGGCSFNGQPRIRTGSYATTTLGTNFIDPNELGKHSYQTPFNEKNGIVYTCRGGHIDIAHVRIAADDVRYLYYLTRKNLMAAAPEFTFKATEGPSRYYVHLKYPNYWQSLSRNDKKLIANEVSLEVSLYLSYTMMTWHEILTWFGYKSTGIFPEFPSAFSWEDNYSNIVGARLGVQAVADQEHDFDEALTAALKQELEYLGVQSAVTAQAAAEKMKGTWWEGTPFLVYVEMKERNMDIGLADGFITPTLVPDVCKGATPRSYPAPTLKAFLIYGFSMKLEVEPKEFEKAAILKIAYPDGKRKRIEPAIHLPQIMDYIKKQAIDMGYTVMPPKPPQQKIPTPK